MYLKLIACEIMVREASHVVATSPNIVDVVFLDQGYHDRVNEGRESLQSIIDGDADRAYDAVLLGYGLCNNLIAGLRAGRAPLIVPRAHDCITLFLGSKERYSDEFAQAPGTYWYTSGWLECRVRRGGDTMDQTSGHLTATYEQYVAKFGEDNARYLMDMLHSWSDHYERGALIRYDFDQMLDLDRQVRAICEDRGWRYDELTGNLDLLRALVDGPWDDQRFLTVPAGQTIGTCWDGSILKAEPAATPESPPV